MWPNAGQNFAGQSIDPAAYQPTGRPAARWMNETDLDASKLLDGEGVVLAKLGNDQLLRFSGDGHICVFAPTGAGKGVGFVQPNLIDYEGSMVVLDPKSENCNMSIRYRRDVLKQECIVLDPFNISGDETAKSTYNPLGALTHAPNDALGPMIEAVADALIPMSVNEREPHWPLGAKKLASFLMWWLVAHEAPEQRHLVRLFELAHIGYQTLYKMAQAMLEYPHSDADIQRVCVAMANWLMGRDAKEFSFFESQLTNNLGWIGDFVWSRVLASPPSAPLDLKHPTARKTVYLILPFNRIERYRPWLRVMVADLLNGLYDRPGRVDTPVLFMLDEAYAGLGAMESLFNAAAAVRSAGGKICLVYQDVSQCKKLYGNDWISLISNSGVTLFWGVNDLEAARMIADYTGYTMRADPHHPGGIKEYLMPPEEVLRYPGDRIIALFRNSPPARFFRLDVNGTEKERYRGKLDKNKGESDMAGDYVRPEVSRDWVPVDLEAVKGPPRHGAGASAAAQDDDDDIEAQFLADMSAQFGGRKVLRDGRRFVVVNAKGEIVPLRAI